MQRRESLSADYGIHWVRPELDAALLRIRGKLEQYAEHGGSIDRLNEARDEAVRLHAAAEVMPWLGLRWLFQALAEALEWSRTQPLEVAEPALSAALTACVAVPDYLDLVVSEQLERPLLLQPLVNEMRLALGQPVHTEATWFAAHAATLRRPLRAHAAGRPGEAQAWARKLLPYYAAALQSILGQKEDARVALGRIGKIAEQLAPVVQGEAQYTLWRHVAAVIEVLLRGGFGHPVEAHRLLGLAGQQLKRLAVQGDQEEGVLPLALQLLYVVATATRCGPRGEALRADWRLAELLPDRDTIERLRGRMQGVSLSLLSHVAQELRHEFADIRDGIDLAVRTGRTDGLEPLQQRLRRVGDTLRTLGLSWIAGLVDQQAERLARQAEAPVGADWMDLATGLLNIEHSLEDALFRQVWKRAEPSEAELAALPVERQLRESRQALLREGLAEFSHARNALDHFVRQGDRVALPEAERRLRELAASLQVAAESGGSRLATQLAQLVSHPSFVGWREQPLRLDRFADGMAVLEMHLEGLLQGGGDDTGLLSDASARLSELAQAPVESRDPSPTVVEPAAPVGTGDEADEEGDEEIRLIFLEEAQGVLTQLRDAYARWKRDPDTGPQLTVLRRAFHTLKGSGRMVGATDIAALGWGVERLLNRCLEGAIPIGEEIVALVQKAEALLPTLIAAFSEQLPAPDELAALVEEAEALAEGRTAVDAEMLGIFREDAQEKLALINAWLADASDSPVPDDVIRAFHTLRGAAGAVGVPAITAVAGQVEVWLEGLRAADLGATAEARALLLPLTQQLGEWVMLAGTTAGSRIDAATWVDAISTQRALVPGEAAQAAHARELADLFSMEALGIVEQMERLSQAPDDEVDPGRRIEALAEQAQVLAGAAQMASAAALVETARALQQQCTVWREVPPDAVEFSRLPAVIEGFYQQLDAYRDGRLGGHSADVMAAIAGLSVPADSRRIAEAPVMGGDAVVASPDTAAPETVERESVVAPASEGGNSEREDTAAGQMPEVDAPVSGDGIAELGIAAEPTTPPEAEAVLTEAVESPPVDDACSAEAASTSVVETVTSPDDGLTVDSEPEAAPEAAPVAVPEVPAAAPVLSGTSAADSVEEAAEVRGVFLAEARELLEQLDRVAHGWELDAGAAGPPAEVQRILHTLKGSSRMAGYSGLGDVAQRLEQSVAMLHGSQPSPAVFARLHYLTDALHAVLDAVAAQRPLVLEALLADCDLQSAQDMAPAPVAETPPPAVAPAAASSVDAELEEIFAAEAVELLESLDGAVQRWRAQPDEVAPRRDMLRALHTFKGGARMAGWMALGEQAHEFEATLERLTETPDVGQLSQIAGHVAALGDALERMRSGDREGGAVIDVAEASEALAADDGLAVASAPAPAARPDAFDPRLFWRPEAEEDQPGALRLETARVPVARLETLLNEVGESSVHRSRLEAQMSQWGQQLHDMEQAIDRLRDQLRLMVAETDAQISARGLGASAPEQDRYAGDFDPLEMDRYTRMQELSRTLNETVGDLSGLHTSLSGLLDEGESLLQQQQRVHTSVQQGLMGTLMVPFSRQVARLQRVVRTAGQELGKQVELRVEGENAELDRNVLERMTAPLEHLLRNAVVHGIETPERRRAAGKPEMGLIRIHLQREGSQLLVELTDDGAGLDFARIEQIAVQRGLLAAPLPADAPQREVDLAAFIFEPGFSTAAQLTQDAGRGIGTDVVASEVKQLGGNLQLDTEAGRGTRFQIHLPLTLAVSQALLVGVGGEWFALPLASVEGIVRIPVDQLGRYLGDEGTAYRYGEVDYRLRHLGDYLGRPAALSGDRTVNAVLLRTSDGSSRRVGVVIDEIVGNREIVAKPVGPMVSSVVGVSSATILPDGRVVLLLDVGALAQARARRARVMQGVLPASTVEEPLAMVVDDSITIRRVTERLLTRNGYRVVTAKDGLDAMAQLQTLVPAVVLLDIEMPRADGFEVASFIRNHAQLKELPIVMITSRSGDKHRERAAAIGVNRYLIKPYQEDQLMAELRLVLKGEGA